MILWIVLLKAHYKGQEESWAGTHLVTECSSHHDNAKLLWSRIFSPQLAAGLWMLRASNKETPPLSPELENTYSTCVFTNAIQAATYNATCCELGSHGCCFSAWRQKHWSLSTYPSITYYCWLHDFISVRHGSSFNCIVWGISHFLFRVSCSTFPLHGLLLPIC